MPNETSAIKQKTRRVKDHILNQYLGFVDSKMPLSETEQTLYRELTLIFAKNVLPRTQEVTGEDGQPLIIQVAKSIADKNDTNQSSEPNSGEPSEV